MTIDEARELFRYGAWATGRMFDAAGALTAEQFAAHVTSSFPSFGATLAHIVGAEWIWLRRWLGESPLGMPAWVASPASLGELRTHFAAVDADRHAFLAPLTDADLARRVAYRTMDGKAWDHALGDLIRHVVNHSTYHRGQLTTMLRQLGEAPPNTDFIRYVRERG